MDSLLSSLRHATSDAWKSVGTRDQIVAGTAVGGLGIGSTILCRTKNGSSIVATVTRSGLALYGGLVVGVGALAMLGWRVCKAWSNDGTELRLSAGADDNTVINTGSDGTAEQAPGIAEVIEILDRHFEHGGSADNIPAALATVDAETLAALTALCERNAERNVEIANLVSDNKALKQTVGGLSAQVKDLQKDVSTLVSSNDKLLERLNTVLSRMEAQTGPGQATPTSTSTTDSDPPTRDTTHPTRPVAAGEVLANQTLHPLIARAIAQRGNDMQPPPSSDGSLDDDEDDSI